MQTLSVARLFEDQRQELQLEQLEEIEAGFAPVPVLTADLAADELIGADRLDAFATAISVILVGLIGPFLGAIADLRGSKKAFLAAFVAIGVACSFGLYFSSAERWAFALTVFVIGNIAVTASLAFYNALLFNGSGVSELELFLSPTSIPAGAPSSFQIGMRNRGASTAVSLTGITITLRPGVSFVSAVPAPDSSPAGPAPMTTTSK